MAEFIRVVSRGLALLSGALLTDLMLLTTADVLKHKTTGSEIDGAAEYTQVLLVLTVYAGMAAAEVNEAYIHPLRTGRPGRPSRTLMVSSTE